MKILCLDLATKTGYAHSDGESGSISFELKRGDSPGMRFIYLRQWLESFVVRNECNLIVYEQAGIHRSRAATHVSHGLIATVEQVAAAQHIETTTKTASEIKKHATGKGGKSANKPRMMMEAENRYQSTDIVDDNHADALLLLDLVLDEFGIPNGYKDDGSSPVATEGNGQASSQNGG